MLTGGTSKAESRDIFDRLTSLTGRRGGAGPSDGYHAKEIKLCYVTVSLAGQCFDALS